MSEHGKKKHKNRENYSDDQKITFESSIGVSECDLISLGEILQKKLDEIDDDREKKRKMIDNSVTKILLSIEKQRNQLKGEIEQFYSEKKSSLSDALSEVKRLQKFSRDSTNSTIKRNLQNLTHEFINSVKNEMAETINFEESSHVTQINLGQNVRPTLEKPSKEVLVKLEKKPLKIVATKMGFVAQIDKFQIIDLNSKRLLVTETEVILNICTTYNQNLSYIIYNDDHFCCKILDMETNKYKRITFNKTGIDPSSVFFGVFKNYIIVSSKDCRRVYNYEISASRFTYWESKMKKYFHKSFHNGFCLSDGTNYEYYKCDEHFQYDLTGENYMNKRFSLQKDLIKKISEGNQIFTIEKEICLFDSKKLKITSIANDIIFKDKRFLDYMLTKTQVLFCLQDKKYPNTISILSYQLKKE